MSDVTTWGCSRIQIGTRSKPSRGGQIRSLRDETNQYTRNYLPQAKSGFFINLILLFDHTDYYQSPWRQKTMPYTFNVHHLITARLIKNVTRNPAFVYTPEFVCNVLCINFICEIRFSVKKFVEVRRRRKTLYILSF